MTHLVDHFPRLTIRRYPLPDLEALESPWPIQTDRQMEGNSKIPPLLNFIETKEKKPHSPRSICQNQKIISYN